MTDLQKHSVSITKINNNRIVVAIKWKLFNLSILPNFSLVNPSDIIKYLKEQLSMINQIL